MGEAIFKFQSRRIKISLSIRMIEFGAILVIEANLCLEGTTASFSSNFEQINIDVSAKFWRVI